jgi:uncharacterized membrane protein
MAGGVIVADPVPAMSSVPYVLRVLLSRQVLWLSLLLGLAVAWLVPSQADQPWLNQALLGWNAGAVVFLMIIARQFFGLPRSSARVLAMLQQDGRLLCLALAVMAALLCLCAVVAELAVVRELMGPARLTPMALATLTFATAWTFTQVMFAQHYAQAYFYAQVQGTPAVFQFSDERLANYRDFLVQAISLGTLGHSDKVNLIGTEMRVVGRIQRVLAVLFNLTLLVLAVNIGSVLFHAGVN